MHMLRTVVIKLWRITCANALAVSGVLSLLFFVEAPMLTAAIVLTVVSISVFYYASLRDFGELDTSSSAGDFTWSGLLRRLWKVTLLNILWIFGGITCVLFCTGTQLPYVASITGIGFVLMYIDGNRSLAKDEQVGS